MPTSNGRIYIDTTAEPDLGVSIDDVGSCLGRGSRDLGTLCQGIEGYEVTPSGGVAPKQRNEYIGAIKAWSKAKPVFFTGMESVLPYDYNPSPSSELTQAWETRRRGNPYGYRNNPWLGNNVSFKTAYGMEIPTGKELYEGSSTDSYLTSTGRLSTGIGTAISNGTGWLYGLLQDATNVLTTPVVTLRWRYEPPLANASTMPFRISDFNEYYHKAESPLPKLPDDIVLTPYQGQVTGEGTAVYIRLDIPSPTYIPEGSITLSELSGAMKANMVFEGALTTNVAKGIEDLYLCALLYHYSEEGGEGKINKWYWVSSQNAMSAANNAGNIVWFNRIHATNTSSNPGGLSDEEIEFVTNTVGSESGRWYVKLFFCTKEIQQNVKPGQVSHLGDATGTPDAAGTYALLRGRDIIDNYGAKGIPVNFVYDSNAIPIVRAVSISKVSVDNINGTTYGVQYILCNYTGSSFGSGSGSKVIISWYDSSTKEHVGKMTGFPTTLSNPISARNKLETTCVPQTLTSADIDLVICYLASDGTTTAGMIIEHLGGSRNKKYINSKADYNTLVESVYNVPSDEILN